jgi:hypothetical protein
LRHRFNVGILQAHAAVSLALAAVLWLVQLVVYPAFAWIDPVRFVAWHQGYTGAVTWVVAPLILLQTAGVVARFWLTERAEPLWFLELACTLTAWAVTVGVSVPIHGRLQGDLPPEVRLAAMHQLVHTNWVRTAAWTVCAACSWVAAARTAP